MMTIYISLAPIIFLGAAPVAPNFNFAEATPRAQMRSHGLFEGLPTPIDKGKNMRNAVAIPIGFFKVFAWHEDGNEKQVLTEFRLEESAQRADPLEPLTLVDTKEALTGLDFFAELPDPVEVDLKKHVPSESRP